MFEPIYESYVPDTIFSAAVPRYVTMREPDWSVDEAELRAAFNKRTRAVIINTPNNPTGKVFTRVELELIAELCRKWGAVAIMDEVYEHIIYDGVAYTHMAALPGMEDRTITVSGISKTFSVTGWRVGYIVAPPELTAAIRKVHDYLTVCAPAPLQTAAVVALRLPQAYYDDLTKLYTRKRDLLVSILRDVDMRPSVPAGAYYVMANISAYSDDDVAFARRLVTEAGVAGVPGSSFYHDPTAGRHKLRFCCCKRDDTLRNAGQRFQKIREWKR